MFKSIFKIFFFNLVRDKFFSIVNVFGLAISIAISLLIFLYVQNENNYDKQITKRDRIYRLETGWAELPTMPGHVLANEAKRIEKVVRLYINDYTLKWNNTPFQLKKLMLADSTFFDLFNFEFIAGNPRSALAINNSIVLTESYAKKVFGNKNPLNEIVVLDNQHKFVITGIIKNPTRFHLPFNAIGTITSLRKMMFDQVLEQFDSWNYPTYILARPGFTDKELKNEVNTLLIKHGYRSNIPGFRFNLTSLSKLYFAEPLQYENIALHGNKETVFTLITIAILILIIASINFINLTMVQGSKRAKEVGLRKVLGGKTRQLIIQFIFETVIFVICALFLSLLIVETISPLFNNLIGKTIEIHFLYSLPVISSVLLIIVIFGIFTGLYPSMYLSMFPTLSALKGNLKNMSNKSFVREGLIIFQLIISIALIISTFQVFKQLNYMNRAALGFNKDHIIYLKLNNDLSKQLESFRDELTKQPGIKKVSYSSSYLGVEWGNWGTTVIDGITRSYKVNNIDPDYFETLGIEVVEGRNFSWDMKGDDYGSYILNETAVKNYRLGNAVGKYVTGLGNGSKGTIIGVVKDFHFQSFHTPIIPVMFYFHKGRYRYVNIKISSRDIGHTLSGIKYIWNSRCPSYPFEYNFMDEAFDLQYKEDERFGNLIGYASLFSILIACLGILGLAALSTEQRTKEIGIRKVNGATILEIILLLFRDFTKWVIIAFIIACPLAYFAMNKWLENFAYRSGFSWWIFILAGFIAFVITLSTVSWQSWKVASKNPVESLKYE